MNQRVTQGQRRQSMEPFPSSRSRHPETPEYKYSSVPLARSHSKNHPVQQKPTPDFPSAQWSSRRDPKQEADYTFGNWKAANPFEIPSFSSHAQSRPPSFNQSQVPAPVSANTTFQASTSASGINTQPRRTQREQRFQHSQENVQQAQAPSSTSSSTWVPKFEPGPSSAPFSFNVSPIEGEGRRRTHASAAQIQQQVGFSFLAFSPYLHTTQTLSIRY